MLRGRVLIKVRRSSLRNSPPPLEPPPHTLVPDIDGITEHQRTASNNAFHSKTVALADSLFGDAALSKGTMKPDPRHATLLALANDRGRDTGMGGNQNTIELTGYGSDIRVTLHTLDLLGVGVHREHLVPAIPQFLEHGVGGDVSVPRDARNSDAVS